MIPLSHQAIYRAHLNATSVKVMLLAYALIPACWGITADSVEFYQAMMGAIIFIAGGALVIWARRVNFWFLPVVVQPPYRCADGPYRWLNHPGYVGMAAMTIGMCCILNSAICLVPATGYLGLLQWRALDEDELLGNL